MVACLYSLYLEANRLQVTWMAIEEQLHFVWIGFYHCRSNDCLHLELGLAPDFVHCIPVSCEHIPGKSFVMSVASQTCKHSPPFLARQLSLNGGCHPVFQHHPITVAHHGDQQLISFFGVAGHFQALAHGLPKRTFVGKAHFQRYASNC